MLETELRRIVREEVEAVMARVLAEIGRRSGPKDPDERLDLTTAGAEVGRAANTLRDWIAKGLLASEGAGSGLTVRRGDVLAAAGARQR